VSIVIPAILIMGFSGTVAQILLLREFLIAFYGNELSIGIILANWLILEATGSFILGKRIDNAKNKLALYLLTTILFSFTLPATVYIIRTWKGIVGILPGEGTGLFMIFLSSFCLLIPVSLSHGALFTYSCKIFSMYSGEDAGSIGKVYAYETFGTIAGGVLFTYLLVVYFNSLEIAMAIALLNVVVCALLAEAARGNGLSAKGSISWLLGSAALSAFFVFLMISSKVETLHWLSVQKQWHPQKIIHYENSVYGNVAVTKDADQYTFFSNGVPIITAPTPDITSVEEFVHLPMLFHDDPKWVMIISGGAGGVINELLKHQVERIDYVELDPLILEVLRKYPTPLTEAELSNPKVIVHFTDGRLFVKEARAQYDLIFIGVSSPQDLQTNRLFTKEFFGLVRQKLRKTGILALTLPGSLTYLSDELRDLNASVFNTLKEAFSYVRIIPGDGTNIFIASEGLDLGNITPERLSERLKRRGVKTQLLSPAYIRYKLHSRWANWFAQSINQGSKEVNRDFRPISVFYAQSLWNALFSPRVQKIFSRLEKINAKQIVLALSALCFILLLIHSKLMSLARLSIPISMTTTGVAGMIYELVLIFGFQSLYGFVFHWIGPLIAAFMVGAALGSMIMNSLMERIKGRVDLFIKIEAAMIGYSLVLPLIFIAMSRGFERPGSFFIIQVGFVLLSVLSGLLIGAEFPLANKIQLDASKQGEVKSRFSSTAGLLYGCDLLGGWVSGILGAVFLLPVLGLFETCFLVGGIKAMSLSLAALSSNELQY